MKYMYSFLMLFLTLSCQNSDRKVDVENTYYKNGNIKEKIYNYKDTTFYVIYSVDGKVKRYRRIYYVDSNGSSQSGHFIDYYDDGRIKYEYFIKKNKLWGTSKKYYPNGNIENVGNYWKGLKDGIWKYYTENGDIIEEINFYDDIPEGMHNNYFEGSKIKKISFRNSNGKIIYYRKYNKLGDVLKEEGHPLSISFSDNVLRVGDTIELIHRTASVPDWDIQLTVKEIVPDLGKTVIKSDSTNKFFMNGLGKLIKTQHTFKNRGSYMWETELIIYDRVLKKQLTYRDTFSFTVK